MGLLLEMTLEQTEALNESEQRFRATFNQAAVGIAHLGLNGQWLMVNQKLCEIVGYTQEELLQLTFQDITYSEDLDTDLEYVRQVLADQIQTYSMEKRYICKKGSVIWINLTVSLVRELTGEPKYFIAVIEDINQRKLSEVALNRSSQRLEVLHTVDSGILAAYSLTEIVHAALSGLAKLVVSEQSFVVLFKFETQQAEVLVEKLTGDWKLAIKSKMPITDFINSDFLAEINNHGKGEISNFSNLSVFLEYPPILQRQNAQLMGSYISLPLVADKNLIGQLILASRERFAFNPEHLPIVSEVANQIAIAIRQTQLREQLQRKAEELEQRVIERTAQLQDANAELEAFAYSVSHDLRAPLRAMQGFSQILLEDYADKIDSLGQEYAHRIVRNAQRMENLIQDLLAYSRVSRTEIKLQSINLASIINNVLTHLHDEFQARQAIVSVTETLLQIEVLAHRTTLIQVLINLLMNAIKFVAPGVQPEIEIWAEERNLNLGLQSQEEETSKHQKWIRLWVKDNGIGIAKEHYDRIFQVFERLHGIETYAGTGIGLAIVRKGIERIGGRIGVESKVNEGSSFWIELPKVEQKNDDS
ncbi:multi-sensor signal transduction histidine kinase [Crinalium epipsammum PCC 9333]|uniref:histidine kinase n=2 Tax=Crinalium TaxID=241421 RepID=K9VYA7_9CYAN|nr:multi-sensor signal transduction histidine kinase [Crinalium epipsammum PCC 9333]